MHKRSSHPEKTCETLMVGNVHFNPSLLLMSSAWTVCEWTLSAISFWVWGSGPYILKSSRFSVTDGKTHMCESCLNKLHRFVKRIRDPLLAFMVVTQLVHWTPLICFTFNKDSHGTALHDRGRKYSGNANYTE